MNLSKEAEDYAKSTIEKRCERLLANLEEELEHTPPQQGIRLRLREAVYLECVNEMAKVIVDTYKDAFKTDESEMTTEDIEEIGAEIYRIGYDAIEDIAGFQEKDVLNTIVQVFKEDLTLEMKKNILNRKKQEDKKMNEKHLLEKEQKRYRVLYRIYEESKENTLEAIPDTLIAEKENLPKEELDNIIQYLIEEGLIRCITFGNVAILHKGIKEIEDSAKNPNRNTEHFQSTVIQNFHGPVYGVQSGGQRNTQNVQVNINPDFNENLTKLIELINNSSLSELQKEDALEALERLPKLAQKEKTIDVMEAAKKRLDLVKTTIEVGTNLSTMALPYLQYLYHWFQS
jgi:hypothetical protein